MSFAFFYFFFFPCSQPIPPTPAGTVGHVLLLLFVRLVPRRAPLPSVPTVCPPPASARALSGRPLITMWRGSKEDVPHRQGGEEGTAFPPQGPGATFHQPNILNPSRTRPRTQTHTHPSTRQRAVRVGTPCERVLIITVSVICLLIHLSPPCQVMKGRPDFSFSPSLFLFFFKMFFDKPANDSLKQLAVSE